GMQVASAPESLELASDVVVLEGGHSVAPGRGCAIYGCGAGGAGARGNGRRDMGDRAVDDAGAGVIPDSPDPHVRIAEGDPKLDAGRAATDKWRKTDFANEVGHATAAFEGARYRQTITTKYGAGRGIGQLGKMRCRRGLERPSRRDSPSHGRRGDRRAAQAHCQC